MQNKTVNAVTAILIFFNGFLVIADKFSPGMAAVLPPTLSHAWPLIMLLILGLQAGVKAVLEHLGKLSILIAMIAIGSLFIGCLHGMYKGPNITGGLEYTQQTPNGEAVAHLDATFLHQGK